MNKFIVKEYEKNKQVVEQLAHDLKVHTQIANILYNRGIRDSEKAKAFLRPSYENMYDPFLMKGIFLASKRIIDAVQKEEHIYIYGDYDVDGVTSTSTLYRYLKTIGAKVSYYIPNRLTEGYGVNQKALQTIYKQGGRLVITVDTGITANKVVEPWISSDMDIIITDHHECPEEVPKALCVINPKQKDCTYPYKMLAGVGVAYKLIQGIHKFLQEHKDTVEYKENVVFQKIGKRSTDRHIKELLDLVAIGTVADIVELKDENRIIVSEAFRQMKETSFLGLLALMRIAGVDASKISAGSIGFKIGPRINAAGRLGDATRGVVLLTTEDKEEADRIAEELHNENLRRQKMEETILQQVDSWIEENIDIETTKIIVVAGDEWHHGVIGIVASRITEKYYRPSIILAIEDGVASGSARSVEGFSIYDALASCKDIFTKFGGHEMAAGMSLDAKKVPELRERLQEYAIQHMTKDTLIKKEKIDAKLNAQEISVGFIKELAILEPFGMGNQEPTFLYSGKVSETKLIGKEKKHLKVKVSNIECLKFNVGSTGNSFVENDAIEIIGSLQINEWNQLEKPQIIVRNMKHNDFSNVNIELAAKLSYEFFGAKDSYYTRSYYMDRLNQRIFAIGKLMTRDDFIDGFKALRKYYKENQHRVSLMTRDMYIPNFHRKYHEESIVAFTCILKVFEEIGILRIEYVNEYVIDYYIFQHKKVELSDSTLYNVLCSQ